jgi:hypothetical protein
MTYSRDYTTDIELDDGRGCIEAPATFSTWLSHPDDLPTLTLETVKLGKLHLSREQLCDWLGKEEVARIEAASVPETWNEEDAA